MESLRTEIRRMRSQLTVCQTLADRLNYHDTPRPFKNPYFVSRLSARTASSSAAVKKNAKQILTLERERVSGGDGFLSAGQVGQRARGEPIDIGKKKKASGVGESGASGKGGGGGRRGNIANLMRGRMKGVAVSGAASASAAGSSSNGNGVSGVNTPMETELGSGQTTPVKDESGDEEDGAKAEKSVIPVAEAADGTPRKEVFTCGYYPLRIPTFTVVSCTTARYRSRTRRILKRQITRLPRHPPYFHPKNTAISPVCTLHIPIHVQSCGTRV